MPSSLCCSVSITHQESAMAALSVGSTSDGDVGGSVRESSRPNVSAKG